MSIQQMLLGVGAVAKKTYIEDIFSTDVYLGDATNNRSIVNNIDLATKGGLVFLKKRGNSAGWISCDTVTGANKQLEPNNTAAQTNLTGTESNYLTAFNTNGFVIGDASKVNEHSGMKHAAWTWRKEPGFFDVVTYTGNSSDTQTISHSLGCVPGLIIVKRTNDTGDWAVLHRSLGAGKYLRLNQTSAESDTDQIWNDTEPTSTQFTAGVWVNAENSQYVAYLFAGGESTNALARSVDFDGSGDELSIADSTDFDYGSGDFTLECWLNPSATNGTTLVHAHHSGSNYGPCNLYFDNNNILTLYASSNNSDFDVSSGTEFGVCPTGQWTHIAVSREGNNIRMFRNGINVATVSYSGSLMNATGTFDIGARNGNYHYIGKISNFRVVKGTAVYTSSFKPPTEPLTNITNTKLLCCNNSSTTGSTVTPGTITANGDPTASTDSPFDDPTGFVFGDAGDKNVIKTGSYVGTGSAGLEVNVGFEPQWIMVKSSTSTENWEIYDSMRGLTVGGDAERLKPNTTDAEDTNSNWFALTANGFIVNSTSGSANSNGETYIFCAIRRSDGYVGKPPSLGSDCFAIDTGNGSSTIPVFDSGFPVDMALYKYQVTGTADWVQTSRLQGIKRLITNDNSAEGSFNDFTWDSNVGWCKESSAGSGYYSWMWKRGAGFDLVAYEGNGTAGHQIPHSLSKTPEMIFVKKRDATGNWRVGHKGLNGGSNPWIHNIQLENGAETNYDVFGNAPTSTHFSLTTAGDVNGNSNDYIAMLFASISGVSAVGSYSGSGSTGNAQNIGFQPRFLIIKRTNSTGDWMQFNSLGGFGNYMQLNTSQQQYSQTYVSVSSTGFSLVSDYGDTNESGSSYIYYAHA